MNELTKEKLEDLQARSNDVWQCVLKYKDLLREYNQSEYHDKYKKTLHERINLAIEELHSTIKVHSQGDAGYGTL